MSVYLSVCLFVCLSVCVCVCASRSVVSFAQLVVRSGRAGAALWLLRKLGMCMCGIGWLQSTGQRCVKGLGEIFGGISLRLVGDGLVVQTSVQ